jgi:hydrogenase maturation factor
MLIDNNFIAGAQTASNLQIRLATAAPERAKRALDDHGDGGVMSGLGEVSNEAAVGHLIAEEEVDPDEAVEGML